MVVSRDNTSWKIKKKKKNQGAEETCVKIIRKKRIAKYDKIRNEEKLNDIDIQWSIIIIRSDLFLFLRPC